MCQAGTCWYRLPFHLIYQHRIRERSNDRQTGRSQARRGKKRTSRQNKRQHRLIPFSYLWFCNVKGVSHLLNRKVQQLSCCSFLQSEKWTWALNFHPPQPHLPSNNNNNSRKWRTSTNQTTTNLCHLRLWALLCDMCAFWLLGYLWVLCVLVRPETKHYN